MSKKIIELTAAGAVDDTDLLVLRQSVGTRKITLANLLDAFALGSGGVIVPPVPADFSFLNQGSAFTDTNGQGLTLNVPHEGSYNVHALVSPVPGTHWKVTALLRASSILDNNNQCGILAWDAANQISTNAAYGRNAAFPFGAVHSNSNLAGGTYIGDWLSYPPVGLFWMRASDDGVNLLFEVSMDGVHYTPLYSEARLAYLTGGTSHIGFYCTCQLSTIQNAAVTLLSWDPVTLP